MLHHQTLYQAGHEPGAWLLVLHGIFGAGRNWASVIRRVVEQRPEWGAMLADLREHGSSRGFEPPHTLNAAAADLHELVQETGLPVRAVLGHSFGGKVALVYASKFADELDQIWFVESTPAAMRPTGEAWAMLQILQRLPSRFGSRLEAIATMERGGVRTPVAQWMATNLEAGEGDGFRWRLDLNAMQDLLQDFFRKDLWPVVESPPSGSTLHVIRATDSNTLPPDAVARIRSASQATGRVHLHELSGSHWINSDNPAGVQDLLVRHLPDPAAGPVDAG